MVPLTIERATARTDAAAVPGAYKSRILEEYLRFLAKCDKPQVLDLGPVSGNNIAFFLENVSKLFVCDIIRRLDPDALSPLRSEELLRLFDYKKDSLDGIHLWDMADHLETPVLTSLVNHCFGLLKPSGLVMMLANNSPQHQPFFSYFVAESGISVTLRQVSSCRLPYFFRSNRDMEILMKPLQKQQSFVCMNGMREFLFKR